MPSSPEDVLRRDREAADRFAQRAGSTGLRSSLEKAQASLAARLERVRATGAGVDSFSAAQVKATLEQVRSVLRPLQGDVQRVAVGYGVDAAEEQTGATVRYLRVADRHYRGVAQGLQLDEAALYEQAVSGTKTSILSRIAGDPAHPARPGVLARYGTAVIGHFERELQQRFLARTPWDEVKDRLVEGSPFLRGAPAHWAERIVRTEVMHANNRSAWETMRAADEQLGDACKILSCAFDDRTGADSIAVHGQIRKTEEAFDSWFGSFQHPPDRPNDRAVVVPHRVSWPIPAYLEPRSEGEVLSRWHLEGRKGSPPGRPLMSTIDRALFGKTPAPKVDEHAPQPEEEASVAPRPALAQVPVSMPAPEAIDQEQELPADEELPVPDALPRPPRFRNEAQRQRWAEARLGELPRVPGVPNDDVVVHRVPVIDDPFSAATRAKMTAIGEQVAGLEAQIRKLEKTDEAPKPRSIRIDRLTAQWPDVRAVHVLEDIHEPKDVPIVVRKGGRLIVQTGLERVVAEELSGRKAIAVHVIDLDAKTPFKPRLKPKPEAPKTVAIPIDKVSSDDFVKHVADFNAARGAKRERPLEFSKSGDAAKALRSIFGDKTPTIETMQKVWGSEPSSTTIRLNDIEVQEGARGHGKSGSIRYSGTIEDEKGKPIGRIVRTFMRRGDGKLEVHHDYFKIDDPSARGNKSGGSMFKQSVLAYEALGVNEITVDAHWVGQYTWASFGYNWPEDRVDWRAKDFAYYLNTRGGIAKERAEVIAKQASAKAWHVAAVDVDGITVIPRASEAKKEPTALGKAYLLEGNPWSGTFKIDPNDPTYQHAKKKFNF